MINESLARQVLDRLLSARKGAEVRAVLADLGDAPEVGLDQPFGAQALVWHAFGDNQSNISTIGLATKPGRSLAERITNAMDAILEERAPPSVSLPRSPRAAAQQWFGRPVTGPDDGLFRWDFAEQGYDRRVSVVLLDGDSPETPTVDVLDDGIGIDPSAFRSTILSLQSGNKITKWHVIGAFGQGGASTLAFCDYAIVVSRSSTRTDVLGFTVIRVLRLSTSYKEDSYAYLAMRDEQGDITVPSCRVGTGALQTYSTATGLRVTSLSKGTLVRHVGYRLTNLTARLSPSPGNLYHYLHYTVFDPLLPFRVVDLREGVERSELVTGSRNRLMNLVQAQRQAAGSPSADVEPGSEVQHFRPMEFVVPPGSTDPCIGIEYWVVFNFRKRKVRDREEVVLRPQSNELFVQTGHPIVGTLNGQNQGELTAQIFRELGLGMVARHTVVHIDASQADSRVRRELFSTSREGFKDGPVLEDLKRALRRMLEEDEKLSALERQLTERLAKRESEATSDEVKRRVTQLLIEAGLEQREQGPTVEAGTDTEKARVRRPRPGRPVTPAPLATLPYPSVTRFEIVAPRPCMEVAIGDSELVLVETDADAEFDRQGRLAIRSEPDLLEQAAKTPLRGGRVRWRLRPRSTATVGAAGRIIVSLTRPDGTQITDFTEYVVQEQQEEPVKKSRGVIPPFDIVPINPDDDPEKWAAAWPDLDEQADVEARESVAYKPLRVGAGITVYYSTIFRQFRDQVDSLKTNNQTVLELFRTNYEVWIGYHAILQENGKLQSGTDIEESAFEEVLELERARVARMQVRQALQVAKLQQRAMQASGDTD